MKYTFEKPINFEGVEYKEINIDFDSLTTQAHIEIEGHLMSQGIIVVQPETSRTYQLYAVAKAAKLPVEFWKAVPFREGGKIALMAYHFLLDVGSPTQE